MEGQLHELFEGSQRCQLDTMIEASCGQQHVLSDLKRVLAPNPWLLVVRRLSHGLVHHCILLVGEAHHKLDCLQDLGVVADRDCEV